MISLETGNLIKINKDEFIKILEKDDSNFNLDKFHSEDSFTYFYSYESKYGFEHLLGIKIVDDYYIPESYL